MGYSKELHKYIGFKLLSLELRGNSLMNKSNLKYSFIEPGDSQESIYTTVLIGPNGTGKSNLFRIVIELFKELYDLSKGKNRTYSVDGNFNLKFSLNGDIFEYSNIKTETDLGNQKVTKDSNNNPFLLINGGKTEFANAQFPLSIVANSIMLTDKYPFYKKEDANDGGKVDAFPQYKYLGVRNIPQSASTRAYVRRTVEFIVKQFENPESSKEGFLKALTRAKKFLDLDDSIDIYYYTSNTARFFKGNLTVDDLANYFKTIQDKYPKSEDNPPYKLNHYLKIKDDSSLLKQICNFCNTIVKEEKLERLPNKHSSIRRISYNIIDPALFEKLSADYSLLEQLRQLGMLTSPEIQLKRSGGYSLQESSSGEYHFFSSIVGLLATVSKTNSLIFIDEPEISLHPNWQMKYLSFLRELFNHDEYTTSHLFIATHSHFLISDLKGESSKIIGLKRTEGKIQIIDLPGDLDTFAWSPDDILYNIFDVVSSRNRFVAEEIAKILKQLSKGSKEGINKIDPSTLKTLSHLEETLKDSDPLKHVVKSILKKVI